LVLVPLVLVPLPVEFAEAVGIAEEMMEVVNREAVVVVGVVGADGPEDVVKPATGVVVGARSEGAVEDAPGAGTAVELSTRAPTPQGMGAPVPGWVGLGASTLLPSAPAIVKRVVQVLFAAAGEENW